MKVKLLILASLLLGIALFGATAVLADEPSSCVECHQDINPGVVEQFKSSKHFTGKDPIDCADCHGEEHNSKDDADKATMPAPKTCKKCHSSQVKQFEAGKHNLAWAAMSAMPMTHAQPPEISGGQKGCGSCHKIGAKDPEVLMGEHGYGMGSCDVCHTRHTFSAAEARRPEACSNCHMGFDHPQWEMYSSSKHGVIYQIEKDTWDWDTSLKDGASYRAPTCQYCHMSKGNHNVITSWGFLGLRVEEPDEEWAAARASILKAVGALDADGNPGALFQGVADLQLARLTMKDWQKPRDKMVKICSECHVESFVQQHLQAGDELLKQSDIVFAHSIETVKDLYADGILEQAENVPYLSPPYPFILLFYDAPYVIEQDLYLQWMEFRQRAFQGAFHNSADYSHWYGWAPLNEHDLRITEEAENLRFMAKLKSGAPAEAAPAAAAAPAASGDAQQAVAESKAAAEDAAQSATSAQQSADSAQQSAGNAQQAADNAQQSAGNAQQAANAPQAAGGGATIAWIGLILGIIALIVGGLAWRKRAS